ncbi:RICIN domain-containing protein [Archangium violaceum]|uniref:RICIN domain-containing protein n=1 Tax=Archangium violaceum TaxID=83451 RepID=UPI00193C5655|nr:RICIN domain-containing protein [Archangium violaceum]QRK09685.1 RICIN domain-containing protein [Archangium violaceum]
MILLAAGGEAVAAPVTVTNGVQFTDTAGNVVRGHDGGMIKVGKYYYWFGANPHPDNSFQYISVYRSTDLHAWEFRKHVLTETSARGVKNLHRPKVIYNSRTGQYVLFMRKENHPFPLVENRVGVATSPTVDGDYTYRGDFHPLGELSSDVSVFQDDDRDRTAYLISTTGEKQLHLTIYRLTPDYLDVAAREHVFSNVKREAQTMFKRNGVYFLVTSGLTGWHPNQAKYATATSIKGPWSGMANLGDSTTYGSQPTYILPIQGSNTTSYLYMGDRHGNAWHGNLSDSEHVWLPLQFPTDRSLSMRWHPQVSIDTTTGVVRGVGSGHAYEQLRAQHKDECLAVRRFTDGPLLKDESSRGDGVGVTQRPCGTAAASNQHWQVLHLGAGYHRIVARHSHKCLTVPSSSTADNARVSQAPCGNGANQQWKITSLPGGNFQITARHSGKCLTIAYDPATEGPKAIQFTCRGTANQQWKRAGAPY